MSEQQYLSRKQASQYLTSQGLPVALATLHKLATTGGGPQFVKFGRRVAYLPSALDTWRDSRLSLPRGSTSEPIIPVLKPEC